MTEDAQTRLAQAAEAHRRGAEAISKHHFEEALAQFSAARDLYYGLERLADVASEGLYIGLVHERAERYPEAEEAYRAVLDLYRKLGSSLEEANVIEKLGDVAEKDGRPGVAEVRWRNALGVYEGEEAQSDRSRVEFKLHFTVDQPVEEGPTHPRLVLVLRERGEGMLDAFGDVFERDFPWKSISIVSPRSLVGDHEEMMFPGEGVKAGDTVLYFLTASGEPFGVRDFEEILSIDQRGAFVIPVAENDLELPPELESFGPIRWSGRLEDIETLLEQVRVAPEIDFRRLSPHRLEELVAELMLALGFANVERQVPLGGGRRADVTATSSQEDRFGATVTDRWVVEVKAGGHAGLRGLQQLTSLEPQLGPGWRAAYVTTARLTSVTEEWLSAEPVGWVTVIDGPHLRRLLARYPRLVRGYFGASIGDRD